ncbi:MAG: helix-turn-helix domain-containing protein [Saprospiraceae bacterium]|nr:helix-turn-helix domain-containing protein [Saprospiraceae bacterium]
MPANILTTDDLREFKLELLQEIKKLISSSNLSPNPEAKRFLKSSEVQELLNLSPTSLQNLRNARELPFSKVNGTFFYDWNDIIELIAQNKRKRNLSENQIKASPMSKNNFQVNYIRHLENFLSLVNMGDSLHFGHVALYVSLFRIWNINYFTNPFSPSRSEIMSHAGIKSKDAFYRNLKELNALDLIRYYPSKSRYEHSYYCISTIEHLEFGFKVNVWGLSNHNKISNQVQTKLDFQDDQSIPNNKVFDINSKTKLFNGKGSLILEKSMVINQHGNKEESDQTETYNPLNDPKYASHLDNRISSSSNNTNYANHQNSQSRNSNLRPSGIQIDPEADYSIRL